MSKRLNFSTFSRLFLAASLISLLSADERNDESAASAGWYKDDGMVMLYEAVTKLSRYSIYLHNSSDISKSMLQNYIEKIDPYGEYLEKEEYEAYKTLQKPDYAGIGIVLYRSRDKNGIYCRVVDDTAKRAGISEGEKLIAVDGIPTSVHRFYRTALSIRGPENTKVTLTLERKDGTRHKVTLRRKRKYYSSVSLGRWQGEKTLKIVRFTRETPSEILRSLRKFKGSKRIVIDLRDNEGGDLQAGIQSAELFLPEGKKIVILSSNEGNLTYISHNGDYAKGKKMVLLQNHRTASASELFIGTLVTQGRAVNIGERTYGKGVAQRFFPLTNGAALLLTYARILLPDGTIYDNRGISSNMKLSPRPTPTFGNGERAKAF